MVVVLLDGVSDFVVVVDVSPDGVVVVVDDEVGELGVVVVVVDEDGADAGGVTMVVDDGVEEAGGVFTTAGGLVTTVGRSQADNATAASILAKSIVYFMSGFSMESKT